MTFCLYLSIWRNKTWLLIFCSKEWFELSGIMGIEQLMISQLFIKCAAVNVNLNHLSWQTGEKEHLCMYWLGSHPKFVFSLLLSHRGVTRTLRRCTYSVYGAAKLFWIRTPNSNLKQHSPYLSDQQENQPHNQLHHTGVYQYRQEQMSQG